MNDKQIVLTDDKGKEVKFNILFTFENDNNKYVLCYEEGKENVVIPFKYDDEGNAFIVEDVKELDLIQDCINSYDNIGDEDEIKED